MIAIMGIMMGVLRGRLEVEGRHHGSVNWSPVATGRKAVVIRDGCLLLWVVGCAGSTQWGGGGGWWTYILVQLVAINGTIGCGAISVTAKSRDYGWLRQTELPR